MRRLDEAGDGWVDEAGRAGQAWSLLRACVRVIEDSVCACAWARVMIESVFGRVFAEM